MAKPHPYARTSANVTIVTSTTTGSTTRGCLAVSIVNVGAEDGLFQGVTLKAGEGWLFNINGPYAAMAFDATGTTFEITEENE